MVPDGDASNEISRRTVLVAGVTGALAMSFSPARATLPGGPDLTAHIYAPTLLPNGIGSRMVQGVNGLDMHILEAGHESPDRPLVMLLHGFPDLAYGWRHLIPILADAGYHVVAPDLRGYGRTTGWQNAYDTPLEPFSLLNMVRDILGLVSALGYRRVGAIVGHDIGSPVAAYCALARPDVFSSVVLMSAPFPGVPAFPFDTAKNDATLRPGRNDGQTLAAALAALHPPKKYYQQYLGSRGANYDMWSPPEGLRAFLRTFYYVKSGDWPGNKPHPLKGRTAQDLAQMPSYYVMDLGRTMPEAVAPFRPSTDEIKACEWLTETELGVYVEEYGRTGFQGGLQAYRVLSDPSLGNELRLFSGRTIDVPSLFVGGSRDWGTYSSPGALDLMKGKATTRMDDINIIDGCGHWIQQERPYQLGEYLRLFIGKAINKSFFT